MKIEIDLNDLGFHYDFDGDPIGRKTLADAVVEAAAGRLLTENKDLAKAVGQRLDSAADQIIGEQIAAVFEQPIQRRKAWGDNEGEPTTVREIIREKLEAYFQQPDKETTYPNGHRTIANLGQLIQREVEAVAQTELAATIKEARAEVTKQIRARTAEAIAKVISA